MIVRATVVVRVVFFDMADTLVTVRPSWYALYVEVCRAHGIALDEAALARAYGEVFARLDRDASGQTYAATREADERYYREINGAVLRAAGVPTDVPLDAILRDLHRAFDDPAHFHLFPDALPALHALRERGYRLGIISNWSWNLPKLCAGLGLTPLFTHIVTSARVGASKPHAAIFQHALKAMEVSPAAAVHVGDNRIADIAGARAVGMRAVLIAPGATDDAGTPYVVRALAELPDLIGHLAASGEGMTAGGHDGCLV